MQSVTDMECGLVAATRKDNREAGAAVSQTSDLAVTPHRTAPPVPTTVTTFRRALGVGCAQTAKRGAPAAARIASTAGSLRSLTPTAARQPPST